jgi:hypothetical protein
MRAPSFCLFVAVLIGCRDASIDSAKATSAVDVAIAQLIDQGALPRDARVSVIGVVRNQAEGSAKADLRFEGGVVPCLQAGVIPRRERLQLGQAGFKLYDSRGWTLTDLTVQGEQWCQFSWSMSISVAEAARGSSRGKDRHDGASGTGTGATPSDSSPATAPAQGGSALDSAQWRRLNVFFSNFAEVGLSPFGRDSVPPASLIQFGVLHSILNASRQLQPAPGRANYERLPTAAVEAAIEKYFGVRFSEHRSLTGPYAWIAYEGGYYVFSEAAGETHPFAQVNSFNDVGNSEFSASITLYSMPDVPVDPYGSSIESLRRAGHDVQALARMRARVRRVEGNSQNRYVLLEYAREQ